MPVYVDDAKNGLGRMVMCHMWADTPEELHAMADMIGMKREWFQTPGGKYPASFPHYDVAKGRRAKAVKLGAIEVSRREGFEIRKRIRARIIEDREFALSWGYERALGLQPVATDCD